MASLTGIYPVARLPGMEELNIGHTIISRAALVGLERAVREMKQVMRREFKFWPLLGID